ncbi:TetR/AcrR family transcriptional regulator C-terminal domain-containing protein [Amycolatopsis sp. PS_44_ISF1]|uniref:TetR/AcrR family transcriptional regulator C-terminal domain-containing protein n=1 Tax=Amycolatopsis sp. PS_44_ISF1 TaxID=2974917 RepID=UPI0028E01AE5|nr:TetR/AcrR family transcriptional regulator C-terminal domain-containing protein [Amycolatopsis sp. PS_44_ISF1]MDT8914239.1 TetR/AcrR family transcriptional regulator C-terminal domain-containing protein [Amycolatopsis sp. PS_44_ISF1]
MKLTAARIVEASMAVFHEVGYAGLSMRQVADRLGVHAGSLYYHVRDKNALLCLMADRVAQQASDEGATALAALPPDAPWPDRIVAQAGALRQALLRHPGGAVLLAGSPRTLSPAALGLMERLLRTLAEAGVPAGPRAIAADAILSHVTGFVLQEQAEPGTPEVREADIAALAERFPLTFTEAGAATPEEKFAGAVRLLCRALGDGA